MAGRFLLWGAGAFAGLLVLAAVLTVAVDPYYVFGTPLVPGWNVRKPAAQNHAVAAKTFMMERVRPRTLLLGNSRIEVGFNPDSPDWPAAMRPVFNAGLGGWDLGISAKLLEDALAEPGLTHVMVGVDMLDFLRPPVDLPPGPVDAGPAAERMRVRPDMSPNADSRWSRARDMLDTTLTFDSIVDSVATVLAQRQPSSVNLTPEGYNPIDDYKAYVAEHGFRDLFDNKYAQYAASFGNYPALDFAVPDRNRSFAALREILTTALGHGVEVTLIVYPYHATVMDLLQRHGLWDTAEAWRRALVKTVAALDPAHRVRIFDFSGYNEYTTERFPEPGDLRTVLRWYWEPGHFQQALGNRIIRRAYDGEDTGFGRVLTVDTVGQVNAALRREAQTHPVMPPDAGNSIPASGRPSLAVAAP